MICSLCGVDRPVLKWVGENRYTCREGCDPSLVMTYPASPHFIGGVDPNIKSKLTLDHITAFVERLVMTPGAVFTEPEPEPTYGRIIRYPVQWNLSSPPPPFNMRLEGLTVEPISAEEKAALRAAAKLQEEAAREAEAWRHKRSKQTGAIIGWRAWYIDTAKGGLYLRSVYHEKAWQPKQPVRGNPFLEGKSGQQGVYAYNSPHHLYDYIEGTGGYTVGNHSPFFAFGTLKMWGTVVKHEHGFRAEYAYPEALYVNADCMIEPLAKLYDVPVFPLARFDELIAKENPDADRRTTGSD